MPVLWGLEMKTILLHISWCRAALRMCSAGVFRVTDYVKSIWEEEVQLDPSSSSNTNWCSEHLLASWWPLLGNTLSSVTFWPEKKKSTSAWEQKGALEGKQAVPFPHSLQTVNGFYSGRKDINLLEENLEFIQSEKKEEQKLIPFLDL